jgi:hypothetical protein
MNRIDAAALYAAPKFEGTGQQDDFEEDYPGFLQSSEPSDSSDEQTETNTTVSDTTTSDSLLLTPVADDTSIKQEPSQHVDYLSHDWREEDIWSSWRHILSQRKAYETWHPSANPALLGLATKYSMPARMRSSLDRQPYGLERSSPFTHRSTAALIYEPEILGFMHDTAVTFFPDNQSAYDIMSYDYAKRNHFKINSLTKGKLQTARGAMVNTLGTVSRPIRFAKESETYMREFHVLPKCVHDIILGSPFLRLTQTFTKFGHRIVNKLRGLSSRHRVCFTGSSQQMLAGWANGQSVLALPDTGSDICLMSAQYARERGYRVDTDPRHRQLLEFVDGSTAETLGRVEGFQWEFDKSDIQLHTPEIHVLEDLQTDLLLGYDFLMHTDAFSTHEELFVDIEPHDEHVDEMFGWLACAIKLVTFSKIRGHGWKALAKLGLKSRSHAASKFLNMRLVQDSDMFADCATTDRVRQSAGMARQRTPRNDFVRRKTCSGARLV